MSILRFIGKWLWRCDLALLYVAVVATAVMMVLTTLDAAFRYFLNSPILGAYEITEKYLMTAVIFFGLSYAYRGGAFIRVTFLVDRLSGAPRLLADYFAQTISLLFCVIFVVATAQQSFRSLFDATTLTTLPIPVGPAYCIVPLGFLVMTVFMLIDLPRVGKGESHLFVPEAPTS